MNVAPGILGTDAVNVSQLRSTRDELRRGIAGAVALVELMPSAPGKTTVNMGYGHFAGEDAIGGTIVHRLKPWFPGADRLMLNAGVGYGLSGDDPVIRAGATFEF